MGKERKYARGTQATYRRGGAWVCDLVGLAKHYGTNIGNVPERIGFGRAAEISLLSREFLNLYRALKRKQKGASRG